MLAICKFSVSVVNSVVEKASRIQALDAGCPIVNPPPRLDGTGTSLTFAA
jgi:hypothetical protein